MRTAVSTTVALGRLKSSLGGGGEPCTLCGKSVYPAERLATASGRVYHKACFSCTKCAKVLTPNSATEDSVTGRLYCDTHYRQLAKAAGLAGFAKGGVDGTAGVLVEKRVKRRNRKEEEDAEVVEGSLVWVELATAPVRAGLGGGDGAAADEPYALAEVAAVKAESYLVRRRGGKTDVEVESRLVWLADDCGADGAGYSDNLRLQQLNEPSLLHNIRRRFDGGIPSARSTRTRASSSCRAQPVPADRRALRRGGDAARRGDARRRAPRAAHVRRRREHLSALRGAFGSVGDRARVGRGMYGWSVVEGCFCV